MVTPRLPHLVHQPTASVSRHNAVNGSSLHANAFPVYYPDRAKAFKVRGGQFFFNSEFPVFDCEKVEHLDDLDHGRVIKRSVCTILDLHFQRLAL
jgi:hypothetical protein